MIPESIRAEIEAKGGLDGDPEPQGNGTTIYRAASGDYVVVDDRSGQIRMRGFAAPANPTAQQQAPVQPAASAPAPAPAGAGGMNQQQLEELLRQVAPNGDPRRLVFSEGVKEKTVRMEDPDSVSGGMVTRTVKVPWRKWTDPGTGRVVEVDVEEGGTYTVTKNAIERGEQGPAATTGAATGNTPRQSRVNPADPTRTQEFDPDKGVWVDAGPNQVEIDRRKKEADAEAERNRPKPEQRNGAWGYWDTKQTPPKWVPITGGPGADLKPVEINGTWGTWVPDPSGGPPKFQEITGVPQAGATGKNITPFVPDPSQPDLGLGAWAAEHVTKIGVPANQGGISQSDWDRVAKSARDQATVYIQNVTSNQNVRRQVEQDARTQRQQLSSESAGDYERALGEWNKSVGRLDPKLPGVGSFVGAIMEEQARYRQSRESQARPPETLHPMFQALPGAAGVRFNPTGAQPSVEAPAMAAPAPSAPPMNMPTQNAADPSTNWVDPDPTNPNPGPAGINPNAIGMTPGEGPVSAWASQALGPQPAPAGQPGVLPDLAAQQQGAAPMFDPFPIAGRMAQAGLSADAIAQAMLEMGMIPNRGAA